MSIPTPPDRTSMQRYAIHSIAFAPDLASIMVSFEDPAAIGGPVLSSRTDQEISLREDDDDLRERVWNIVDELCDILDEVYKAHRRAART